MDAESRAVIILKFSNQADQSIAHNRHEVTVFDYRDLVTWLTWRYKEKYLDNTNTYEPLKIKHSLKKKQMKLIAVVACKLDAMINQLPWWYVQERRNFYLS